MSADAGSLTQWESKGQGEQHRVSERCRREKTGEAEEKEEQIESGKRGKILYNTGSSAPCSVVTKMGGIGGG